MVKHVILWNLKDELTEEQRHQIKINMKKELEALKGQIDGLLDIKINIDCLETSNAEVMLDSSFESEEALKAYAVHPKHVYVADTFVRPYTAQRKCMDFEV